MGLIKTDEVNLRLVVDGSPLRKELATVDQSLVTTRDRIKELMAEQKSMLALRKTQAKGGEEYLATAKAMEKNRVELGELRTTLKASTERAAELRKEIGLGALSLRELRNEATKLRIMRDTASANGAAFAELDGRLSEVNKRIKVLTNEAARHADTWSKVRGQYKLTGMSMEQLELEAQYLKTTLHTMTRSDPMFGKLRSELKATEAQMASMQSGLGRFGRAWQGVKGQIVGTFAGVGALFAGGAMMNGVRNWISGAAKMSDSLADVRRTTGLTEAQVTSLNKRLRTIDTRTSRAELLELAAVAGKLGINAEKDVLGFVRAADQIKVALGEDLGEGAIRSIGKLVQTFKVGESRGYDLERSLLSAGSAVNELGNSSTAAEAYLVDYASRLAGVNVQSNISIENTLGYAAAADQLNLKVETTATAMSQFTIKAFKEPAAYAKIAGMEVAAFTKLLKEDTNEALLLTLEGLNGNNAGLDVMVNKFGDLGQEGARAVSVLASLSGQTKLIREQQVIANRAFAEGTSITKEFAVRNENFAANLEKIGKALRGWFVNSSVVKGFKDITSSMMEMIRVPVSEKLEEERIGLQMTYAKILQYNEGSSERTKLIQELQKQYPGFLANMDAEKVSNDQLGHSIKQLNEQLVNKIILQRQQEKIDKQGEKQADRREALMEKEKKVGLMMAKMADEAKIDMSQFEGMPLIDQARKVLEEYDKVMERRSFVAGGMGHEIGRLHVAYKMLNEEDQKGLDLAKERQALMKELGISTTDAAPPPPPSTMPDVTDPDADPEAAVDAKADAARKAMEALRADMLKLQREMELDGLSADEREIARLDDKFAEIRRKTLENAYHTKEDLQVLENTYEDARAELLTQQADERERKAVEAKNKALAAVDKAEDDYWQGKLGEEDQTILAEQQRLDEMVAMYEAAGVDTQNLVRRTEEAIAAIREKFRADEKKKANDLAAQTFRDQVAMYSAVAGALGGVNALLQASYDATGKKAYEQTVAAKALGLMQIAISSGVGVAEAIKAGAGLTFPANLGAIATGVGAVLTGIASAVALLRNVNPTQMNSSTSNSSPPTLNNVPIGEDGMVLGGPSHRNKGLKVINSQTGQQEAELEGGELVMSKRFTEANRHLLPQLLAASKAGTRLNYLNAPVPAIDVRGFREAATNVKMAEGGVIGAGIARALVQPPVETKGDDGLKALLMGLGEKLDNIAEVAGQKQEIKLALGQEYDDKLAAYDKLKRRNTISRN